MRILLTGNQGFIGSALETRLIEKGHTVFGIDCKQGREYNLLTVEDWPRDIDLVIHLAGLSGVRESINNPSAYWINNVEASRKLFDRYQDTRIVYASSSSAYEPDLNPYAASKYILEELAARYPDTLGLRLHTVYSDTPRPGMFFDKLLGGTLEYTTNHYRDFVHIEDVLDAIEILIKKTYINGVVDVGSGVPIKISKLAPGVPIRLNTPGEREWTCANIEKLKTLGYKPKYTVENFLTKKKTDNIIKITTEKT
jgi:nucleoside-diphosphate-sugar epimerase